MFWIIIAIVAAVAIFMGIEAEKAKAVLKKNYELALQGNNKQHALAAGRAYYSSIRKDNKLTIYDEQAIANDISVMNT